MGQESEVKNISFHKRVEKRSKNEKKNFVYRIMIAFRDYDTWRMW